MLLAVLFVLGAMIATSSAAFDNQQQNSVITADLQTQVQDMKCGEEGCGKKAECSKEKKAECAKDKKCCGTDASCCKKAECSKEKKAECAKEKKCCGTDGACCKKE